MTNIITILILAAIVCGITAYLIREKRNGRKCIGCPAQCACSGKCGKHGPEQ